MKQTREAFWKPALPQRARWVRQASGVGWVRRGEQCRESGLACDRGWRGIAPSVAVFQCSFSLGTSVMEVNVVFYVMCKCLQNRECVCVCGGKENREKKKKISESCKHFQSNILWLSELAWICPAWAFKRSVTAKASTPVRVCVCMWEWIHMFILMCPMYMCHMHVCGGGFLLNLYGSEWIPVQAWLSVLIRCSALGEVRWWGEGLQWAEAPRVLVIS